MAQLESQSSLSVDVEGGIQSYSAAQVSCRHIVAVGPDIQ